MVNSDGGQLPDCTYPASYVSNCFSSEGTLVSQYAMEDLATSKVKHAYIYSL